MAKTSVVTLDLNFQGMPQAIAAYLIRHAGGAILVESGPGSTIPALQAGLAASGLSARDVTHVLLTHIHLDHAGAAGWLASQGATIYVHPVGAPHLMNPEKLLRSARRIYGDRMETLWGEILPVPEASLVIPRDEEEIRIGSLRFVAIDTPGHAEHHYAYLFEDLCFSGDIGGVRIPGFPYLRIPMPPPELHFEKWRASVKRLGSLRFDRIAPTHFGIFDDVAWHLRAVETELEGTVRWLEDVMRLSPEVEELRRLFLDWVTAEGLRQGLSPEAIKSYELANPLGMSADGLFRYWHKVRNATAA
jgi:glyoxylase-like metal-dependent hydrolase (beta-lactamase superfamily II)